MEPPQSSGEGGKPPHPPPQHKKELLLKGPRPSPLQVSPASNKIKKPQHHRRLPPPSSPPPPSQYQSEHRQPVVIYSVSPKVIYADESNFMSIVQRLTGISAATSGDVSPAIRLASIERASPTERTAASSTAAMDFMEGAEVDKFPGILSPAPSALTPVPVGIFFSPAREPLDVSFWQDLSPFWNGSYSPSSVMFSAPFISSSPTPSVDLFDLFLNSCVNESNNYL